MSGIRGRPDDAGFSLVELLVAIVILGTVVVALLVAVGTSITSSTQHRRQANLDVVARDYAEALRLVVNARSGTGWCRTSAYTVAVPTLAGVSVSASNSPSVCPAALTTSSSTVAQVQRVDLTVTADGASTTFRLQVAPACPLASC